jgi:hypothetical protein
MNKPQIREITAKILDEVLEDFGEPKVAGPFVVFVENEPDEFRMAVVSTPDALEEEFDLATEGGLSLAVGEADTAGYYNAMVAIKRNGENISAAYTISEFQLKGLWLRLKRDPMVLETLTC